MAGNVGLRERLKAGFREHPISINKRIDVFLVENLPDLITEHRLAVGSDLKNIDKTLEEYEGETEELISWRGTTKGQIELLRGRVERLEHKYGIRTEVH